MFEKIKHAQEKLDHSYFGGRKVKSYGQADIIHPDTKEAVKSPYVLVEYDDDKGPKFESVHIDEWTGGASKEPVDMTNGGQVNRWFVDRTDGVRRALHKVFETHNPRFNDIPRILQWVLTGYTQAYEKCVNMVFGVEDFKTQGTVDMVCKKVEEMGEDVTEGLDDFEKKLLELARSQTAYSAAKIADGSWFAHFKQHVSQLMDTAVSTALGSDDIHRRTDDLQDILEEYAKPQAPTEAPKSEAGGSTPADGQAQPSAGDVQSTQPSNGGDAGASQDAAPSPAEGAQGSSQAA